MRVCVFFKPPPDLYNLVSDDKLYGKLLMSSYMALLLVGMRNWSS